MLTFVVYIAEIRIGTLDRIICRVKLTAPTVQNIDAVVWIILTTLNICPIV
ncbi:MAG: hypothetical protein AAFR24_07765 [Cyanobacteria bacterium J06627_3]